MGLYASPDCNSVVMPVAARYRMTPSGIERVGVITEEVSTEQILQTLKEVIESE